MSVDAENGTTVTLCEQCNTYVWQTAFDLDEPIRDGFQDVEEVLCSSRDCDTYGWEVRCGVCDTVVPNEATKYQAWVVFRN